MAPKYNYHQSSILYHRLIRKALARMNQCQVGIAHHFWRKITEALGEANQQLTMENAKLREEIRGRNFVDIGTSSKDKDLESLMSEPVGEDMASVTLPAPVSESFAASLTDVKALTALGLCKCSRFTIMHMLLMTLSALNNARLETQRIRLEMETKNSKADNEKEQLERHLSNGESVTRR